MTKDRYMALDDFQSLWTNRIKPFIQADTLWKKAQELSTAEKAQVKTNLGLPQEIYSKTEVNGLVDTPHQNYETVNAFANLPATGSKDTIYRVANYDGSLSQVDDTKYSEYAWDGTQYVFLCVKSQIGEVFDISVYNNNAKYADLAAALGSNGANVPSTLRKGGMSIKYVQSSDNKYVQYRYMPDDATTVSTFTNVANWQGVDEVPVFGSKNLIESGGAFKIYEKLDTYKSLSISEFTLVEGVFISGSNAVYSVNAKSKYIYKAVTPGEVFRVTYSDIGMYWGSYTFLRTITPNPTNLSPSDNVGFGHTDSNNTYLLTIPDGCNYLALGIQNANYYIAPNTIEKVGEYTFADVKKMNGLIGEELTDADFTFVDGVFISGTNGKYAVGNTNQYMYIPVVPSQVFTVIANGNGSHYVFLRSITQNPTHYTDSDNVGYGYVLNNQYKEITIPSQCNYLAISTLNAGINIKPRVVIKGSDDSLRFDVEELKIETEKLHSGEINKVYLIPVYGQSLAIGGDAPLITTFCRFPRNCGNTTSLGLSFTGQEVSSFGLIESYVDNYTKEDDLSIIEQDFKVVSFAVGTGSTSIIGLAKGTTNYSNLISSITAAKNSAVNNNLEIIVPAFCWVQGEQDRADANTNDYKGDLVQLRSDLDADIKEITGQEQDVHCIVYQTNQLSMLNLLNPGYFAPNNYKSGADEGACITVPQAQYELIRDNQYFHASTPIYPFNFVVSSNQQMLHIDSQSQKLMGYYEGLAAKRLVDGHGYDIGLIATGITKIDSTHIEVSLKSPFPPIVIDTMSVKEVANYGFSVVSENNTNIISSVEIGDNNYSGTKVIITTSENCTNAKLRYGINGTDGKSGFKEGSRGNIRDSQGDFYTAFINGKRVRMDNWLYFFEILIS